MNDQDRRRQLRRQLRAQRDAVNPARRARIARHILLHVARQSWLRAGRTVAVFVGTGAEIDTTALRELARARGCHVYLPRIVD